MLRFDPATFQAATRDARKIIVVDLGFLGDTVHLIPALWEMKDHYPQAELHVLTTPVGREVLQLAPCVQRAWAFPLGPPSPSWWEHWSVLREMRRERFDLAFNFNGVDRPVITTFILGARNSIAREGGRKHFWKPWLIRHWVKGGQSQSLVSERHREFLGECGFTLKPARFDLRVPEEDRRWAQANVPRGAVHISLSASSPLKEWPMANNLELARQLLAGDLERKLVVTATANPREQGRVEQLRREIADERLLIVDERLTIARLAALLEQCAMHVGPDSGVLHLAAALGLSTVAIFRRYSDMAVWLPRGPQHICFDAPCQCLGSKNPPCAAANEASCLGGISAELVAREICRRLAEVNTAK